MITLKKLYARHTGKVSDKWSSYLDEYERIFLEYRKKTVRILEIGVQNGGSLEIWSQYFASAQKIVGCDINPTCAELKFDDPRIAVVIGNANSDKAQKAIITHSKAFDIIIEDGSHLSGDIVKSFARYFSHLENGGVFIAEDLHCSYWQNFEGGLYYPFSAITFFKRLADIINGEHWGIEKDPSEILHGFFSKYGFSISEKDLQSIHSVQFFNSMCVVRKEKPEHNRLNARVVVGSEEVVLAGISKAAHLSLSTKSRVDQINNKWAARSMPPSEELLSLVEELAAVEARLSQTQENLADARGNASELEARLSQTQENLADARGNASELEAHLSQTQENLTHSEELNRALHNSTSWKVTKPLRMVKERGLAVGRIRNTIASGVHRGGGILPTLGKVKRVLRREGIKGLRRRYESVRRGPDAGIGGAKSEYERWIGLYDSITEDDKQQMRRMSKNFADRPLISVVMPTYNTPENLLREAIESVLAQTYENWELCIADDCSTDKNVREVLEEFSKKDKRIKVVYRKENGHISKASNSALEIASGEWVALLDHDDLLAPHALFCIVEAINKNPDAKLLYSDEDKVNQKGERCDPYFKCDWNYELFLSHNLITHLGVYHHDTIKKINGFCSEFDGAQDYDLALRFVSSIDSKEIIHIPHVLYHWRVMPGSTAMSADEKPYAMTAGERAVNDFLKIKNVDATADLIGFGYRVRYALPANSPLVSIIIPTRNGKDLVKTCIDSIETRTVYKNYEIILVDNGSDEQDAIEYFNELDKKKHIRVIRDDRPFNYSALVNNAVEYAKGSVLVLLNNDIEVISLDWLEELTGLALQPGVGAVGAKLLYPDDSLQHGGVILGLGGLAAHAHWKFPRSSPGYVGRAALRSNFTAVSAACLAVKKEHYTAVDGLDEKSLAVAYNDVDFCLKLYEKGLRNIWTPFAEMYHYESATRGYEDTPEKKKRFQKEKDFMLLKWDDIIRNDPAYSPNLTLDRSDFSLAFPPRVEKPWVGFYGDAE